MAEANGAFEADPERVWADVYSYNRPGWGVSDVTQMLDEFETVGMLTRWEFQDKKYGYFNGINGNLPSISHVKRGDYKITAPDPPEWVKKRTVTTSSPPVENPHGLGLGLDKVRFREGQEENEENVPLIQNMKKDAARLLQFTGTIYPSTQATIKLLAEAYGSEAVEEDFQLWLESVQGERIDNPYSLYVKIAHTRFSDGPATKEKDDPRTDAVLTKIYSISGQIGSKKTVIMVNKFLEDFTPNEIIQAFIDVYGARDPFKQGFIIKDFFDDGQGKYAILDIRERLKKEREDAANLAALTKEVQSIAEEENRLVLEESAAVDEILDTPRPINGQIENVV